MDEHGCQQDPERLCQQKQFRGDNRIHDKVAIGDAREHLGASQRAKDDVTFEFRGHDQSPLAV